MHTDTLQLVDERRGRGAAVGLAMTSTTLRQNTLAVVDEARTRDLTTHVAAYELAQERVRAAMRLRGQVPAGAR